MSPRAGILGVGSYLPERVLTNTEIETFVDTTDEWIRTRTGIRERRIVPKGTPSSDLGAAAARVAIQDAGLAVSDIDAILVATTSPDMICPSTACMVQRKIHASNAAAVDLLAACSGFVYGVSVAAGWVNSGMYRHVLVIGCEALSSMVDWTDRATCVLFGDGAGAAVIGQVEQGGIRSVYLGADGQCGDLLEIPAGGSRMPASHESVDQHLHTLKMKGHEVFKWAVRRMIEAVGGALEQAQMSIEQIDCVIPHQANIRILNSVAERLKLTEDKVYINVHNHGNISAASTIIALHEAMTEGRVTQGDHVLLVTFGSGFTWGATVIQL